MSPRRLQIVERQGVGRKAAADAEQGSSSTGARKLEHIKRENGGEQQGPLSKRARRLRNDVAKPADSNCSDALSQVLDNSHGCVTTLHALQCKNSVGLDFACSAFGSL